MQTTQRFLKSACLTLAFCAGLTIASRAQTFTVLAHFGDEFAVFNTSFVQGRDGNLYGTAIDYDSEDYGHGVVLKVTTSGALTVLHIFCSQINCSDGAYPVGTLVLGTDGNFYGVAGAGGITNTSCGTSYGCGVLFKITPAGDYSVLHYFKGSDGIYPSGLIEGSDRNFYGTTSLGGSGSRCVVGCGTIFKMTTAGLITTLHNFNESDGIYPTGLTQGTDSDLYGTTYEGGEYVISGSCQLFFQYGCGTVFKITTGGAFTLLHSFSGNDGAGPDVPVAQASDGTFYGTTFYGNYYNNGTVFRITANGQFKTVYQFLGIGMNPVVGMYPASDGSLYSTTIGNGNTNGFVYNISLSGVFTTIYNNSQYQGYTDNVVEATSGTFYGGNVGDSGGVIYSLDTGLGPFIAFVLPSGNRGQTAQILGQGLKGSTSVTFNGVPAANFTVVSDTYITAVVPSGATTGPVVVTTPSNMLTSNQDFQIMP